MFGWSVVLLGGHWKGGLGEVRCGERGGALPDCGENGDYFVAGLEGLDFGTDGFDDADEFVALRKGRVV